MPTQSITNNNGINSMTPVEPVNQSTAPLTAKELSSQIENIMLDGIKNKWDHAYTAHQISESLKNNPEAAKELNLDSNEADIKTKMVDPFCKIMSNAAQKNNHIIFLGVGPSAFIGSITPGTTTQKGYGITGTLIGIAFDTNSKELKLYRNSGEATPDKDSVAGLCAGIGVSAGELYGSWEDFFGTATEENSSSLLGITKISTPNGKIGWNVGIGDGLGICFSTMQTLTKEIKIKP